MVQQLLSLGRLDPELRGALDGQATDLVALAGDVGSSFIDRAFDARIELELVTPQQPLWVTVQPELMAEALGNLIDNALRYTGAGGRVRIDFETDPPALRVNDSGDGAPGDGSGLGPAIVREIAELHGARVSMGVPEAGGACVTLRFPAPA